MSELRFDIVYTGEIIAPDRTQVIQSFARMFRIDVVAAERILSAPRKVLKKGVDESQAKTYQRKLSSIGVLVSIEAQAVDIESVITLEPEQDEPEEETTDETTSEEPAAAGTSDQLLVTQERASTFTASQLSMEEVDQPAGENTNFAAIEDTSKVKRLKFSFTGSGTEFFKIWIVNVLLSIITLGVYSAWAKVRTHQYFHSNTWLEKDSFEYLANPIVILRGRIVALVLFLTYGLTSYLLPALAPLFSVLFLTALPWMIANSLRFRMRNTAYRTIRFGFDGTLWGAAWAYSLMFLLAPLTLGLVAPYMLFLQAHYRVDNSRYGADYFSFGASPREYYRVYFKAFLALLAVASLGALSAMAAPVLAGLVVVAGYSLIMTFIKVEMINLMFDNAHLGDHSFSSRLEMWPYFSLHFVNTVLMILTLGLFYPWARVRIARYRAECLNMMTHGSLNYYVARQEEETSAIGEELGGLFDFELGF